MRHMKLRYIDADDMIYVTLLMCLEKVIIMGEGFNNMEVKRRNRKAVFTALLAHEEMTKPELSMQLQLSLPTVGVICDELLKEGLIEQTGMKASGGGRRAMKYRAVTDEMIAGGIDITRNNVYFTYLNLKGQMLAGERFHFPFEDSESYIQEMKERFRRFTDENQLNNRRRIGTGVSVAGVVRADYRGITRSHVLNLDRYCKLNRLPEEAGEEEVLFFNDADAACMAECYWGKAPDSFVFLALSNTVGGATVIGNRIAKGKNGRGGEFGHVLLVPGGRSCYCGLKGHYDPYGSALNLTKISGGSMPRFFELVEGRDEKATGVFESYLRYLSMMVYNIHVSTDLPVILGGYVGSYLKPYLGRIRDLVGEQNLFQEKEEYVFCCEYAVEASAVGAAGYFVRTFTDQI